MKKISLDNPIARGRTADIYHWYDGHIPKLFHKWFDLKNVEYELQIARASKASRVQAPAVRSLIRVQGRNGLIYERATGDSMEIFIPLPISACR